MESLEESGMFTFCCSYNDLTALSHLQALEKCLKQ